MIKIYILSYIILCITTLDAQNFYNGISFVGSGKKTELTDIQKLSKISANAIALSPYSYLKSKGNPNLMTSSQWQWWGESEAGIIEMIRLAKTQGLSIMLKPHIYIWGGEFVGSIDMKTEENWKVFEKNYTDYILNYAKIAEDQKIEIFCIGVELTNFAHTRSNYWTELILQVRKIYKGKITYAANWDAYSKISFWNQLDFIGIDQYFPISKSKNPSTEEIKAEWKKLSSNLENFSKLHRKQILFCEYGYRSVDYNLKEPWVFSEKYNSVNLEAQSNALEGLYISLWNKEWMAGGFLWKWFVKHNEAGGKEDTGYTIQNKPAELIVNKYYQLHCK